MNTPPPLPTPTPQTLPVQRKTSGLASASLMCGILSLIGGAVLLVPPVLAVVFGHIALTRCKRDGLDGRGVSIAGLVMGYFSIVLFPLLAAMAIPAFAKVRQASIDKAVLNNARQLAAAADQYYLESGAPRAHLQSLIGPTNYMKFLDTVAHETYPTHFTQGRIITITGVAGARTITYAP